MSKPTAVYIIDENYHAPWAAALAIEVKLVILADKHGDIGFQLDVDTYDGRHRWRA